MKLDEVEHTILRKQFNEPRIHFALVCASRSCPKLRNEAYEAAILNQQIDEQGRTFSRDRKILLQQIKFNYLNFFPGLKVTLQIMVA